MAGAAESQINGRYGQSVHLGEDDVVRFEDRDGRSCILRAFVQDTE